MAGDKKFFLGIGGQQTGPFGEQDVLGKISSGEAKPDTLVWYEGLGEWQRIDTIAYFQGAFKKASSGGAVGASTSRPLASTEAMRPIFSSREAVFHRRVGPSPRTTIISTVVLVLAGVLYWYVNDDPKASSVLPRDQAFVKGAPTTRPQRLQKADADFLLNPNVIPDEFIRLVGEDYKDEVGQRALAQLEGIYKKKNRFRELGELYVQTGRPVEAVQMFIQEKLNDRAEKAAFDAYQKSTDSTVKRDMLVKSIELLTGPLQNPALALARIEMLEKEFPTYPHAFGYYTLTKEKKMADLFDRTSFFFVESLITHMKSDFPQIKLGGRPTVSIFKEGGEKYRIVGSYAGEVSLSMDKLKNIKFEYWLVGNDWELVSTNVTSERQSWAKTNKTRQRDTLINGDQILNYLESVMRAQFPKLGLHERISREELETAARTIATKK